MFIFNWVKKFILVKLKKYLTNIIEKFFQMKVFNGFFKIKVIGFFLKKKFLILSYKFI